MEPLKDISALNKLDPESARRLLTTALRDVNNRLADIMENTPENPEARALERKRDELGRHIRRITANRRQASHATASGSGISSCVEEKQLVKKPQGVAVGQPSSSESQTSSRAEEKQPARQPQDRNAGQSSSSSTAATPRLDLRKKSNSVSDVDTKQEEEEKNKEDKGKGKAVEETRPCVSCAEDQPLSSIAELPCGHYYCSTCLNQIFKNATTEELSYPPRCCKPISLAIAAPYLDWEIAKNFLRKQMEFEAKVKTYCSNKECLAFIPPDYIEGKEARCPKCKGKTCSMCKKALHGKEVLCGEDEALSKTIALMRQKNWARCPRCGLGVELAFGCNHIT